MLYQEDYFTVQKLICNHQTPEHKGIFTILRVSYQSSPSVQHTYCQKGFEVHNQTIICDLVLIEAKHVWVPFETCFIKETKNHLLGS